MARSYFDGQRERKQKCITIWTNIILWRQLKDNKIQTKYFKFKCFRHRLGFIMMPKEGLFCWIIPAIAPLAEKIKASHSPFSFEL